MERDGSSLAQFWFALNSCCPGHINNSLIETLRKEPENLVPYVGLIQP